MKSILIIKTEERGVVSLIEATFVFPIMFIIVFIMMMAGNAYYQKARVERAVVECTLDSSARCANPMLGYVMEHDAVPRGTNDVEIYPYRYIIPNEMKNINGQIESKLKENINNMNSVAFRGMEPKNVSVEMSLNWYVIASYIDTKCKFKIELPIRMLFSHNNMAFQYEIHIKEPIADAPNLVRNTSMVQDYLERTGLDERISKTRDAIKKYTKFLR